MYDIAIIGAGIIGCTVAAELSRFNLRVLLLEGSSDVANGTTKANSAIVHAGFDPKPGSLKARLNVAGNTAFPTLCRDMGVHFRQCGSLVIAFSGEEMSTLEELLDNGRTNGVPGLEILEGSELHRREEGLSPAAQGALYAPTAGITDPYGLAIALAESAVANGVEIRLNSPVSSIEGKEGSFTLQAGADRVNCARVVNAAGLYADRVSAMAGDSGFTISAHRGEYFLLDKTCGSLAQHVLFPCPTALGKGVLIAPTAHGNLIVGPNSEAVENRAATETTSAGLDLVSSQARKIMPALPLEGTITTFSGLRAKCDRGDFIIEQSAAVPGLFNVAGIESPGLVSAPAIAGEVVKLLEGASGPFQPRKAYRPAAKNHTFFLHMNRGEQEALLAEDPRFGRVICRCEGITEGEIVRAVQGPVGASTLDGVKRRTRPGGGRCQGGFCGPRVLQIIARERGIDPLAVNKDNAGSHLLTGPTKGRPPQKAQPRWQATGGPAGKGRDKGCDVAVIGGGPAGMAAAVAAREAGANDVLIIERDVELGGILQQCIHNGFGLHYFREELTGPEYAGRFIERVREAGIRTKLDSMVLQVGADGRVTYLNTTEGLTTLQAGAVILAMGCRERARGAVFVPGTRPAGIFSAGTAQRLVNMEGYMVGKKAVVFGSGDIGLIMARRLVLEGAEVLAVIERKNYSDGLVRNYVQCLEDFGIPMLMQHTIVAVHGRDRVTGITLARTGPDKLPLPGTEREMACDTVLFSRGLIPENELTREAGLSLDPRTGGPRVNEALETELPGIFACGNVVHVHDLVDWVTEESIRAGRGAAAFLNQKENIDKPAEISTRAGAGISYIVPQVIRPSGVGAAAELYLRVKGQHEDTALVVRAGDKEVKRVRKKALTPGEMIVIKVRKEDLPAAGAGQLTVELAGEGKADGE